MSFLCSNTPIQTDETISIVKAIGLSLYIANVNMCDGDATKTATI